MSTPGSLQKRKSYNPKAISNDKTDFAKEATKKLTEKREALKKIAEKNPKVKSR